MSVVDAILCARMGSSRLPGKVLLPAAGKPMLELTMERLRRSRRIRKLVVATSDQKEDDTIANVCSKLEVLCYRGSAEDVLDRVYRCACHYAMEHVAYFGADNPLIDPSLCDEIIGIYVDSLKWDYVTNNYPPSYPDGEEVEVVSVEALGITWSEGTDSYYRKYLLSYFWENPQRFRIHNLTHEPNLHHERWTLDFQEDYELLRTLFEALYPVNQIFGMSDIIEYLDAHPELRGINAMHREYYPWLRKARGSVLVS